MTVESDALDLRTGLPAEFRYLEASLPREAWTMRRLHPSASHWLEIHNSYRGAMRDLVGLGADWREQRLSSAAYRAEASPQLHYLLSSLHGHHHIESDAYFPAFKRLEPAMVRGFDLLDRDHAAIEQLMSAMMKAVLDLDRAAAGEQDLTPHAGALVNEMERGGLLIGRHLSDEEEIVVPVFTLRGDPFDDF